MASGETLFWAGLIVAGVAVMSTGLQPVEPPPPVAEPAAPEAPPPPPPMVGNGYLTQELVRNPDGHFYVDAQVNGAPVRFMIDTGASIVALTTEDAQRAGIHFGDERATITGVGGPIEVIPVTIDRIAIGGLSATQIEAAIGNEMGVSLLGQSFLSRVGRVEIEGDRMVLR